MHNLPGFEKLPALVLAELNRLCVKKTFQKGEMIYFRGGEESKIYLLLAGEVKLYRSAEGRKIVIQVLKNGDFFGDLSFTGTAHVLPADNFAQADQTTTACVISAQDLNILLKKYPEVAMILLVTLRDRLHQAESKIKDMALAGAETRLLNELLRHAVAHGKDLGGVLEIEEKLTHQELADMTGVSRETVTKSLNELIRQGMIEYGEGRVIRLHQEKILNNCLYCLKLKQGMNPPS
ncbi:MAG: Crp/Fnr family transcriptional regulator [Candidatus Doudnabacteria bacterium]|nr:Crp/Fnr family transcriptional regulator [Candidatus Doudnabacteria bacterium]